MDTFSSLITAIAIDIEIDDRRDLERFRHNSLASYDDMIQTIILSERVLLLTGRFDTTNPQTVAPG